MRFDLDKLNGMQLKVVVLEISSNDLCDFHTKPEKVGSMIITLVEGLWNEFRVDWVVIGQILHQKKQPYPHYNSSVVTLTKRTCQKKDHITLREHHGLAQPIHDIYVEDGIHLNRHRQALLLRSYHGAILRALKQLQL